MELCQRCWQGVMFFEQDNSPEITTVWFILSIFAEGCELRLNQSNKASQLPLLLPFITPTFTSET